MRRMIAAPLLVLVVAVSACAPAATPEPALLDTAVAGTLTAVVAQQPTDTPFPGAATPTTTLSPLADVGTVTGRICYPADSIPPMMVYFEGGPTGPLVTLPIAANQGTYATKLNPGTYIATAWLPGFTVGGSYSRAVPCGLTVSCTDHTPLPFSVAAGATVSGIDLCDWYGNPGDVPLPPGAVPVSPTPAPSPTPVTPPKPTATSSTPGGISGSLSYPGGTVPPLVIVAFNTRNSYWWWVGTGSGWTSYSMGDIPPGTYHVVAYAPSGLEAGFGPGTSLQDVIVEPGEVTTGINLNDWAPSGTYPAEPAGINYP